MRAEAKSSSYGRGARVLSVGIATTGLVTFAYFSLASHSLSEADYGYVTLLWSVLFVIISLIYRPVEQLLSRTIAGRRAQGHESHPLRAALTIQASAAALFLVIALAFREQIRDDVFDGSEALYWVLVVAVLAYGASYFARGWLAGHQRFGLYGGLVLLESCSRCLFAVAVAIGIASGVGAVALGIAAAPLVSLAVMPFAIERRQGEAPVAAEGSMRESAGFAVAVLAIMAAEQAMLNLPVLAVDATADDAALTGIVFNVLLITRAPLQLFQAIQTSLLPHLSGKPPSAPASVSKPPPGGGTAEGPRARSATVTQQYGRMHHGHEGPNHDAAVPARALRAGVLRSRTVDRAADGTAGEGPAMTSASR